MTLPLVAGLLLAGCAVAIEPPAATPTPAPELAHPTPEPRLPPLPEPEANAEASCPSPFPQDAGLVTTADVRLTPTATEAPPLSPFAPLALVTEPDLEAALQARLDREEEGTFGVVVKRIDDGRGAAINPRAVFYAASLYKTAVMLETFHQRDAGLLDLAEPYVVSDYYAGFDLGPGALRRCQVVTLHEALRAMMAVSDNVAAVLLQDRVGSRFVNEALQALGARDTGLLAEDLPTTAADQALLMEAIVRGKAVSREASQEMLNLLGSETFDFGVPAGLPEGTLVAHKTGQWHNATHDAGIVFAPSGVYVIAVLTDLGFESAASGLIADVSRLVYEYFEERYPATPAPAEEG